MSSEENTTENGAWPSHAAQGVRNTLVHNDHAPITNELFSRIKQGLYQRTTTSKDGGACRLEGGGTTQIWPQRLLKN